MNIVLPPFDQGITVTLYSCKKFGLTEDVAHTCKSYEWRGHGFCIKSCQNCVNRLEALSEGWDE